MSEVRCATSSSPFSVHNPLQCSGLPPSFHAGQEVPEAWNIKQVTGVLCEDAHLGSRDVEQVLLLLSRRPSSLTGMQEREGFLLLPVSPTLVFTRRGCLGLDHPGSWAPRSRARAQPVDGGIFVRRSPGGDPNTQTSERRCGEKQQETRKPLIRRCPLSPPPVPGFQSSSPGNSHLCTKKKKKKKR